MAQETVKNWQRGINGQWGDEQEQGRHVKDRQTGAKVRRRGLNMSRRSVREELGGVQWATGRREVAAIYVQERQYHVEKHRQSTVEG